MQVTRKGRFEGRRRLWEGVRSVEGVSKSVVVWSKEEYECLGLGYKESLDYSFEHMHACCFISARPNGGVS